MPTYTAQAPHRTTETQLVSTIPAGVTPVGYVLKVNNVLYPTGYIINYSGQGYRRFYVSEQSNNLYLNCETLVVSGTIPSVTLSNVEIKIIV